MNDVNNGLVEGIIPMHHRFGVGNFSTLFEPHIITMNIDMLEQSDVLARNGHGQVSARTNVIETCFLEELSKLGLKDQFVRLHI